ncbi:hypothetical protein PCH_Pc18g02870 [Penicillium rubens Wisconsin 54-1255]|uniref:Uncharacterized protein n=1 Tax=Penicillium rubens (strain ATCC 28089 / DSM 1075 / NRRL 1951 / Wisconsin 54-1255) TaxID=500485 RepID=B6HB56_PENRW|nr:hypothetical protein PCH_Pc18g02870 [Penicillium rubens Wisconsin 54-1255]
MGKIGKKKGTKSDSERQNKSGGQDRKVPPSRGKHYVAVHSFLPGIRIVGVSSARPYRAQISHRRRILEVCRLDTDRIVMTSRESFGIEISRDQKSGNLGISPLSKELGEWKILMVTRCVLWLMNISAGL